MPFPRIPGGRTSIWLILSLALGIAVFAGLGVIDRGARARAYGDARADALDDAAILAAGLQAELDKFSLVPLILADDTEVRDALAAGRARVPALDRRFEALARQTSAAAIYVMDARGVTLAASNWRLPTSFVGSDYSFRRYFRDALAKGAAGQFALGTVSRMPGLYIAQRVEAGGKIVGVVAVKVEFDTLETNWRRAGAEVFVTDADGVVLITSRDEWRFHLTRRDPEVRRDRALDLRQFGLAELPPLRLPKPLTAGTVATALLDADQPIRFGGWHLHLLVDPASKADAAISRARLYALLALVTTIAAAALAIVLKRRREAHAQRLIEHRTQDLREQLGQANRLAILGQVTAGIGHEINQPVAAVQVYAENGARLLDRGDNGEARANFTRIVDLAERIGRITTELRGFARRGSAEPEVFPIGRAIDGALMLLHDRIERSGVTLTLPGRERCDLPVRAEPVRLEQVLVNLLQNALDAIGANGTISLSIDADAHDYLLRVADNGPGLAGKEDALFHPFATSKPDGLGLGLVISRDIMRALGGELTAEPTPRGACFVMRIPRA
ncbi:ATP-binding protein [Sphingomonas sp.]|uniref:sensor histidine kinase n=1 Tax=Sphingomonas sp. TaxID=28214 RepID=UPI001ED10550|nr:ATP-binding protein [Sphingomonas sp.]MBX3594883.1 sensor histidine kinase [Sphingomonas sp.]